MTPEELGRSSELFAGMDAATLARIAGKVQLVELAGGDMLFREGDPADAMYVVHTGRLRVGQHTQKQRLRPLSEVARGETVGEMALITGENRTTAVQAIRDSLLIRISREHFDQLLDDHPQTMAQLLRLLVKRMQFLLKRGSDQQRNRVTTVAIVSALPGLHIRALASNIAKAFARQGSCAVLEAHDVDAVLGPGHAQARPDDGERSATLVRWLDQIATEYRYVLYEAGDPDEPWASRCLRQADRVLLLVPAAAAAEAGPTTELLKAAGLLAPVEVVFLHNQRGQPLADVLGWRSLAGAKRFHHLRSGNEGDVARVVRMITRRAVGVVLSGGGARGAAHIGLLKALEELKIPIDVIGGASMGAFVGGMHAMGRSSDEIRELVHTCFVASKNLNDYTWPTFSLIRGQKIYARLHDIFAEQRIQDLPISYFCNTTNLTARSEVTHDSGSLHRWCCASMSVPGIAPPTIAGGEIHVDGGVLNNLPTETLQRYRCGRMIASDVGVSAVLRASPSDDPEPVLMSRENWRDAEGNKGPGLFELLYSAAGLDSVHAMRARARLVDLYLRMPVEEVGMFGWEHFDEVIEGGYRMAMEKLPALFE